MDRYVVGRTPETGIKVCRSWGSNALPVLLSILLAFSSAQAQLGHSSILGTVRDSSGARLSGALVTITDEATGISRSLTTGNDGLYEVPFLPPGRYTLRAEMPGFAAMTRGGIEAEVRQEVRADFNLSPAQPADGAGVPSPRPQPAAESRLGGPLVRRALLAQIPLLTRDFASLQVLSPGAQPGSSVGRFAGRELSEGFRVAGGTMYSGYFSVEGADNNRAYYYGNASSPSLEMIQAVRIVTAGSSAEYGGGAHHVDVLLRGGGKTYQASIFEYLQHDRLNARNSFSDTDPSPLRRSQFGASFSGPLPKEGLFLFGVYEGVRQREAKEVFTQVATADQRSGMFPLAGADALIVRDPLTNKPFPGNIIPADRFSPVARYFLDHVWPLPNAETQLYRGQNVSLMNSNQFDAKADYTPNLLNSASVRISRQVRIFDEEADRPLTSPRISHFNSLLASVLYTKTINPRMVNSFFMAARRDYNANRSHSDLGRGAGFIDALGMNLGAPYGSGYPVILISGRGFSGRTGSHNTPTEHSANVFQYRNTLRWMKGRHRLSLGVEVKRFQNREMDDGLSRGQFNFSGSYTGSSLADFFLGLPNQLTFAPALGAVYLRNTQWAGYVHDDWKIRNNLTLGLGLRYEYVSWPTEKYDRMATSHPQLGMNLIVSSKTDRLPPAIDPLAAASYPAGTIITTKQAGLPRSLRFPDRNNFSPRIGLAYAIGENFVLRAGYGIDYIQNSQAVFNDRDASFGLPFRTNRVISNPAAIGFNILQPFAHLAAKVQKTIESARYIDPNFVRAYVQTWSLHLERALPAQSALQVGYLGNRMVHGKQYWNWNQSPTWPNRNDRFAGYLNIVALTSGADSRYDSLQVRFRKHASRGLCAEANYAWSKTLSNVVDEGGSNSIWVHDPARQWGRSPWDRTHTFTGVFVWDVPLGRGNRWLHGLHPVLDAILGGWQLSGILKIWSGSALTVTSSLARANLSVQGSVPADRIADGRLDPPTRGLWFDPTAFATPPAYRPGDAGYGILAGPGLVTEDLGLYKTFRFGEVARARLRLEAFNALDHVNLANPFTDVDIRSLLGKILAAGPARRLQVALRLEF